jgi:hypothetical protein
MWFSSYVGIFRKKTLDETMEEVDSEGNRFGTHKLITLKSRFQGRDASGHDIFVKKPDGKLTYNFINYEINNFAVTEKECAEDMYSKMVSAPKKNERERLETVNPFEE